ncbi:MAG: Fic family protein [Bacteroidota bacterium]
MKTAINIAREAKGLKMHELAHQLDIDASLMSRIANGKRKPTTAQLKKICTLLELDFNEMLKTQLSEAVVEVIKEYPEIASEVMQVAEARIQYLSSPKKFETINTSQEVLEGLEAIDALRSEWKTAHPLNATQLQKLREYFHTSYTHESNKIEGNTLTLQETHLVINEGITIGGKSVREHLEVINHKSAIQLIEDLAEDQIDFTPHTLKQLHQLVLKGIDDNNAGRYRRVNVRISGSEHVPPEPHRIHDLMEDYFSFYEEQKERLHPVILAAEMHERLVTIHPFIDGNGRTSRLVMNLILLKNGYTMANLKGNITDRMDYYASLQAVQIDHENESFYQLITDAVLHSLKEHLSMVEH